MNSNITNNHQTVPQDDIENAEAPVLVDSDLKDIARATFIVDGNRNHNDTSMLATATQEAAVLRKEKKSAQYTVRTLSILSFVLIITMGIMEVSNYFTVKTAMESVKDTKLQGDGTLASKDGQPIATNSNEYSVPIGALGFLPSTHVSKIDSLDLELPDGNTRIYRHIETIDVHDGSGFAITTTNDDKLVWDPNDGSSDMTVTLSTGDTFEKNVLCATCTTLNVVYDDEVVKAMENFIGFMGDVIARKDEDEEEDGHGRHLGTSSCCFYYKHVVPNPDILKLLGCNSRG